MHLTPSLLSAGLFISSLVVLSRTIPLQPSDDSAREESLHADGSTDSDNGSLQQDTNGDDGYSDFEDDDFDDGLINLIDSEDQNIQSVMHLHKKGGEILVPCFGMWWPVGGGGGGAPSYYYIDYYGDYRKKRRRQKRKKSARLKKKKS